MFFHWIFNDEDIDVSVEEEEDIEVVKSQFRPYQDEPLKEDEKEKENQAKKLMSDGLSPKVLESDMREQFP